MRNILIVIISSVISAFIAVLIYANYLDRPNIVYQTIDKQKPTSFIKNSNRVISTPTDFVKASSLSTSAVVYIESNKKIKSYWGEEYHTTSTGSGVIISPDGYIATNNHVVSDSDDYIVQLNNEKKYTAILIGKDPTTDLALLKIEVDSLPFLQFGNSDLLNVGEWVLAVGNPFSLQSTVTAGIVSAKGRNINILENQQYRIESFIQTDAVVNPGNSGGALVNVHGDLIGINSAILSHSGQYEGYSFAIPSNLAEKVLNDLKIYGNVQRGLLGVSILDVNQEIADALSLTSLDGVYLRSIFPNTGAEDAGLKKGDVLTKINGISINGVPNLQEQVGRYHPGDSLIVEFRRNHKLQSTMVILKNQVNTTEMIAVRKDKILKDLGMEVRDLTQKELDEGFGPGIRVLSIFTNSKLDNTGMVPSFIISHINDNKMKNTDELILFLKSNSGKIEFKGMYENHRGNFKYVIE